MKVYVLFCGEEYGEEISIAGVFSSKEKTEEFIKRFPQDDGDRSDSDRIYWGPEEIELDFIPGRQEGKDLYKVFKYLDGISGIGAYKVDIDHIKYLNQTHFNEIYTLASSEEEAIKNVGKEVENLKDEEDEEWYLYSE